MIQENNNPTHLLELLKSKQITNHSYQFRLKANELQIKTYKQTKK